MARTIDTVRITDDYAKELAERLSGEFRKQVAEVENNIWQPREPRTASQHAGKKGRYLFKFQNGTERVVRSFIKSVAFGSNILLVDSTLARSTKYFASPEKTTKHFEKTLPPECSEVLIVLNLNVAIEKIAANLCEYASIDIIDKKVLTYPILNPADVHEKKNDAYYEILARPNQADFRKMLLKEYKSTCMITKCKIEAVLEAAHIKPFADNKDDTLENGLLLRADLHLLFDKEFMGIHPNSGKLHFKCTDGYYDEYTHAKIPENTILRKNLKTRWKSFNENKGAKK